MVRKQESAAPWELTTARGVSLYVGALLGPGLLMLPGVADQIAGPASVLAWAGLLGISGLFAIVFTALGIRLPGGGGVIEYTTAGLGARAGRTVGWCFVTAVVLGAPVVCLIGAGYVTEAVGVGRTTTAVVAAVLLAAVTGLTLAGARVGSSAQMTMIALLLAVIAVAVIGALPSARNANWQPFAPHGLSAVGQAASVLMLSFVGWEAIAPLTSRLADPRRTLPRITFTAFCLTALIYLGLAATVIAVLGPRAATTAPVADLMRVALGKPGPALVAGAAALLTLATVNAYLTGAVALATHLRNAARPQAQPETATADPDTGRRPTVFFLFVVCAGLAELSAESAGQLDPARMVTLPTALFLVVYIGSTASAARLLRGPTRIAAVIACAASGAVLAFCGLLALFALSVAALAYAGQRTRIGVRMRVRAQPSPFREAPAAQAHGREQVRGVVDGAPGQA